MGVILLQKNFSKDVCRNPEQFGQISKVLFKTSMVLKKLNWKSLTKSMSKTINIPMNIDKENIMVIKSRFESTWILKGKFGWNSKVFGKNLKCFRKKSKSERFCSNF